MSGKTGGKARPVVWPETAQSFGPRQAFLRFFSKWLDGATAAATSIVRMDLDSRNDAALVTDTLSGDREAFGQLYDRYARLVRAIVAGVSGDWFAVEDMVQESFLRAYRKLAGLRDREQFGAWVSGIARQIGRERRRSLRRDRHEFRELQISDLDASADVEHRDQLELVMERLAELEERERLAVHAFFLEQREAVEVAEMLGMSRSGLYALVQRAIARLATPTPRCKATKEERIR